MAAKNSRGHKYFICSAIGLLIMLGFRFLPPVGEITPLGMNLIGIFFGVIFLWCTVGVVWPSIFAMLLLVNSGFYNMNQVIQASFGNQTVWIVIYVFFLISAITKSGAAEWLARWFISRKSLAGKPFLFTWVYCFSFFIISMFSNGAAIMVMSWSITKTVINVLGVDKESKYAKLLYIFSSLSCALGESTIPFKGYVLGLANSFANISGTTLSYAAYITFALLMGLTLITLMVLSMIYIFKADTTAVKNFDNSVLGGQQERLNFRQSSYMLSLVLVVLLVLIQTILPKDWAITQFLGTYGMQGIIAFAVAVLIMIKIDGEPIYDFKRYATDAVRWEGVFIVGSISPLASAIGSAEAGVLSTIGQVVEPIFGGSSVWVITILVLVGTLFLTNLLSNSGIGLLLIPVVIPILQQIGVSNNVFVIICVALIYTVTLGVMLPGASTLSALFYTNEDLNGGDIFKYGGYMCLLYLIVAIPTFLIWLSIAG